MKKIELNKTVQIIDQANNILILGHINPDGDCVGSMAALSLGLQSVEKKITVWSDESLPLKYRFIKTDFEKPCQENIDSFDLIIVVDTAVETRIGAKLDFSHTQTPVLAIDHHIAVEYM